MRFIVRSLSAVGYCFCSTTDWFFVCLSSVIESSLPDHSRSDTHTRVRLLLILLLPRVLGDLEERCRSRGHSRVYRFPARHDVFNHVAHSSHLLIIVRYCFIILNRHSWHMCACVCVRAREHVL